MGGHGSRPAPNQTSTSLHAERLPERSRLARLKEAATEAAAGCESRALEIVELRLSHKSPALIFGPFRRD